MSRQTMVQLTDELVADLDRRAGQRGISRSALIRQILGEHLADDRRARISEQIVAGYRRVPPGTPDQWGDLEDETRSGTAEVLSRLDDEERRAGIEPW